MADEACKDSVQCYAACATSDISTPNWKHVNNVVLSLVNKREV